MKKSKLLFQWLYRERSIISKIYLLALLQGAMYLSIPIGIQGIVTYIMAGKFSASLILLSSITVAIVIFIAYFQLWQMRINETLHQSIFGNLAAKLNYLISHVPSSQALVLQVNKFTEVVILQKGISKILLDFSFSIISIVFGLIILPAYSSWFFVFSLMLGLAFYYIISHYGKKGIDSNLATSNEKYQLLEWFQAGAGSNDKTELSQGTDRLLGNYFSARTKHFNILEKQFLGIIIFKILFIAILLFLGAYLVQIGELNIGQFIASEIIIFLVINAVEKLVSSLNICYDIVTALYKIEDVFNAHQQTSFISEKSVPLPSLAYIYSKPYSKKIKGTLMALFISAFIVLFLPWTQNVKSDGKVSTINPEFKPQKINSRIGGRVEKWFIKEGDFVNKNDTIAYISEIKDEYVDPLLITRSEKIIKSKETSLTSYEEKIKAVNAQIDALNKSLQFKIAQARNKILQAKMKIATDSIDCQVAANNYKVAEEQLLRYEELMAKGVISKTDLENRRVKVQDAVSKKTSSDNKFLSAKNELLNAEIDLNTIQQEFQEKLMKAESDKFSALSLLYEGEGSLTKLQNQLANYSMRKGFYYVLAPQAGYIANTHIQGIGEVIKEGAALCEIVPTQNEKAVELYVMPVDLPLIRKGQRVQIQFDGWPAFVFSGWPGISYGTYAAEVVAFDRTLSDNGKFRVLAKSVGKSWPEAIQMGGGVKGFALLNNVPLIYELWRQVNGFPPEFYDMKKASSKK